jgi:Protein of unknown function (DUF3574)
MIACSCGRGSTAEELISLHDGESMRVFTPAVVIVLYVLCTAFLPTRASQVAPPSARAQACGPSETAYLRTTLYFGLARPTGRVSEGQWQAFLRTKVTPRFPDGLTAWEADGQGLSAGVRAVGDGACLCGFLSTRGAGHRPVMPGFIRARLVATMILETWHEHCS